MSRSKLFLCVCVIAAVATTANMKKKKKNMNKSELATEIKSVFVLTDTNKDGLISFEEVSNAKDNSRNLELAQQFTKVRNCEDIFHARACAHRTARPKIFLCLARSTHPSIVLNYH